MPPVILRDSFGSAFEHVRRRIDRDNMCIRRISAESDSGPDSDFEHAITGSEIQSFDNLMLAIDKNSPEEKIVEASQV